MATVAQIRNSIQTKIFDAYGKSVTLSSQGTPTYDARGDIHSDDFTNTAITIVPYDIIDNREDRQPFGDIKFGEMAAAVPYTVTINVGDQVTMEGDVWEVKDTLQHYLPDNLVTIVLLAKVVS